MEPDEWDAYEPEVERDEPDGFPITAQDFEDRAYDDERDRDFLLEQQELEDFEGLTYDDDRDFDING